MIAIPSRRSFITQLALGAGMAVSNKVLSQSDPLPASQTTEPRRKLGIALMGLGSYSSGELGPALRETKHCRLTGVITGNPAKGHRWSREYGFSDAHVFNYDTIERIAGNPEIDIIYVVTPPGLHKDHVLAAAKTGKHIICEKPMANSVAECDAMIAACRAANVQLSIGYRLEFEPHHQLIDLLAKPDEVGPFSKISGAHSLRLSERTWRVDRKLAGGGPLMDVGIYVIQAAVRAAGGASPLAATAEEVAKTNPELFDEVEEAIRFRLEFPGGAICEGSTSYAERRSDFRAESSRGWIDLNPAYSYRGISGETHLGKIDVADVNQQALQMDDFAQCVATGRPTPVPGEMGRQHLAIIEAIYEAARTGKRVDVKA